MCQYFAFKSFNLFNFAKCFKVFTESYNVKTWDDVNSKIFSVSILRFLLTGLYKNRKDLNVDLIHAHISIFISSNQLVTCVTAALPERTNQRGALSSGKGDKLAIPNSKKET